jgi:hypothetical protein
MNHHLSVTCTSCGGFIQNKIENIDLFETVWKIIESPRQAFRTILLAKHKNYTIVLSGFAGIGFLFTLFWLFHIGEATNQLLYIIAAGIVFGPAVGIFISTVFSLILAIVLRSYRISFSFNNVFTIVSYSLIPIVFTVILVLPIELLTFGRFTFTASPTPFTLKPLSAVLLFALDIVCTLWSFALAIIGIKVLGDIGWSKATAIFFLSIILFGLLMYFCLISFTQSQGVTV